MLFVVCTLYKFLYIVQAVFSVQGFLAVCLCYSLASPDPFKWFMGMPRYPDPCGMIPISPTGLIQ